MSEELERLKNFILNNKGNAEMMLVQSLEDENKELKEAALALASAVRYNYMSEVLTYAGDLEMAEKILTRWGR
jgi:hypothetical protein